MGDERGRTVKKNKGSLHHRLFAETENHAQKAIASGQSFEENDQHMLDSLQYEAELEADRTPIIMDLQGAGIQVDSIVATAFRNIPFAQCGPAFEILKSHFSRPYRQSNRRNMAYAMGVLGAHSSVWAELVFFYKNEHDNAVREALASAMVSAFTPSEMEDVIEILKDASLGGSRIILLRTLSRSRQPLALATLYDLKDDPDLKLEIAHILKQKERYAATRAKKAAKKASGSA